MLVWSIRNDIAAVLEAVDASLLNVPADHVAKFQLGVIDFLQARIDIATLCVVAFMKVILRIYSAIRVWANVFRKAFEEVTDINGSSILLSRLTLMEVLLVKRVFGPVAIE